MEAASSKDIEEIREELGRKKVMYVIVREKCKEKTDKTNIGQIFS